MESKEKKKVYGLGQGVIKSSDRLFCLSPWLTMALEMISFGGVIFLMRSVLHD
jgi:hypothetical protein